jgi:type I restriction enzyme S subunit
MSSEWSTTTVGEFCPFKYGKGLPERDRKPGRYGVYSSAGLVGSHEAAFVNSSGVVIGRKGTVGSVTYSAEPFWPIDTAFYVEDQPAVRDIRFTYYLLKTLDLHLMNTDSAVPGLNRENAHALEVRVPSIEMQKIIADFLQHLDDRIALLRETNTTLEAIAQALFKSWFVDFDPVQAKMQGLAPEGMDEATAALFPDSFEESELGSVPKGWKVKSLDAVASFLNGLALQKFPPTGDNDLPVIKIAQLRKGDTVGADLASRSIKPEYVVQNGDVLFSWSGSLEVEIWCGGEGALNQHLFKVTSGAFPKWFYFLWTRHHLEHFRQVAASKATTMGHIQRAHLTGAKVLVPGEEVLHAANSVLVPILNRLIENSLQAFNLAALRDNLLPRLISGQIQLPEVSQLEESLP